MIKIIQISIAILCLAGFGLTSVLAQEPQQNLPKSDTTMSLDHVPLHVANVETTISFYSKVLNIKEIPSQNPQVRWLSIGDSAAIHVIGDRTTPVTDYDDVHFAIAVRSLDPIMVRLKAEGIVWYGSDDKHPYEVSAVRTDGIHQIYFKDPDGYWIEINDAMRATR